MSGTENDEDDGLVAQGWGTGGPTPADMLRDALKAPITTNVPSVTATGTTIPAPPPPPPPPPSNTLGDADTGSGDTAA